jgi:quinolinate synthase
MRYISVSWAHWQHLHIVTMALHHYGKEDRVEKTLAQTPSVQIFLQPIAPPAVLGLAGFASSTSITRSYITNWWEIDTTSTISFPLVSDHGSAETYIGD